MDLQKILGILLLLILPVISFANTPFKFLPQGQWFVGAFYGLADLSASGSQQMVLSGTTYPNTFTSSGTQQGTFYGIQGGYNILRNTKWLPSYQIEVAIWQTNGLQVQGTHTINNPSNPAFDASYNYQYQVQWRTFSFGTTIDIIKWRQFLPFIGAGVDFAMLQLQDYQETPIGTASSNQISFQNNNMTQFLYHARLGLRYQFPKHWQMQLAYTYYPSINLDTKTGSTGVVDLSSLNSTVQLSSIGFGVNYQF